MTMPNFSKSKLLALRQCPKRFWLECHQPHWRANSAATQALFQAGHQVGDLARSIFDPEQRGDLIDLAAEGVGPSIARTAHLLGLARGPIFEAGFSAGGGLAFADALLPVQINRQTVWRLIEVKSSTRVNDSHRDDVAIQAHVAKAAGVQLLGVSLAHIDTRWVYGGDGDYSGLLVEQDLTADALARGGEVRSWIAQAQRTHALPAAPPIEPGPHCLQPHACGFQGHCARLPQAVHPVACLSGIEPAKVDAPHGTLHPSLSFDEAGAAADVAVHGVPATFLDLKSVQFAVPRWRGCRPYEAVVFQFSVHRLSAQGERVHTEFVDLSGQDPSIPLAHALVAACGSEGPVFVHSSRFDTARIRDLVNRLAHLPGVGSALRALSERVVNLLPIARTRFDLDCRPGCHPAQKGSGGLRQLLSAVAPAWRGNDSTGVQNPTGALAAYTEAVQPGVSDARKAQLRAQLSREGQLDSQALLCLWQLLAGHPDWPS